MPWDLSAGRFRRRWVISEPRRETPLMQRHVDLGVILNDRTSESTSRILPIQSAECGEQAARGEVGGISSGEEWWATCPTGETSEVDKHCRIPDSMTVRVGPVDDRERFYVTERGVTLISPEMLGQRSPRRGKAGIGLVRYIMNLNGLARRP